MVRARTCPSEAFLSKSHTPYRVHPSVEGGAYTAKLIQASPCAIHFLGVKYADHSIGEISDPPRVLLGYYGYVGVWTEFTADGSVLCDNRYYVVLGQGRCAIYRALKASWKRQVAGRPQLLEMANSHQSL